MARNGRNKAAGDGAARPGDMPVADLVGSEGVATARQWLGSSLASLAGLAAWLEQMQSLQRSALAGWMRALELCARDVDQATDPQRLAALPARMVNHQLEEMSRHLGGAMQDLVAAQARWADEWRRQLTEQVQQAGQAAAPAIGLDGDAPAAALAAVAQLQDQWLAMGQQWLDMLGTSGPVQGRPTTR